MLFPICPQNSQIFLCFFLLYAFSSSQMGVLDLSITNKGSDSRTVSQKLQNENLIMKQILNSYLSLVDPDNSCEHVPNVSYAKPPFSQNKERSKRTVEELASVRPPVFLLALEEINKPGCKEKREISQKMLPLCLFKVGDTIEKRNLMNDSMVEEVIEKYFPKIEQRSIKFKGYKKFPHQVETLSEFKEDLRLSKRNEYTSPSETVNMNKVNVITKANKTLDHISKLTECDFVEMPDEMKKPLIAVLMKRISNIFDNQNRL